MHFLICQLAEKFSYLLVPMFKLLVVLVRGVGIAASGHAVRVSVKPVVIATAAAVGELFAVPAFRIVEVLEKSSSAKSSLWFEPTKLCCNELLPLSKLKLIKIIINPACLSCKSNSNLSYLQDGQHHVQESYELERLHIQFLNELSD